MTTTATPDDIVARARELGGQAGSPEAVTALTGAAGGDRALLEAARDRVAALIHVRSDDWEATAALTLLNRTLSNLPRHDPLDWKVRWGQRFRRP